MALMQALVAMLGHRNLTPLARIGHAVHGPDLATILAILSNTDIFVRFRSLLNSAASWIAL
jgi:hypothetical protein